MLARCGIRGNAPARKYPENCYANSISWPPLLQRSHYEAASAGRQIGGRRSTNPNRITSCTNTCLIPGNFITKSEMFVCTVFLGVGLNSLRTQLNYMACIIGINRSFFITCYFIYLSLHNLDSFINYNFIYSGCILHLNC